MEEITLLNFFGDEYHKYQQRVSTGLPFIKGFKVELWYIERDHPDQTDADKDSSGGGKNQLDQADDARSEESKRSVDKRWNNRDRDIMISVEGSCDDDDEDDRRNMTGGFYHGRNRRYSGSYDNVYDESTIV